jgi:Zn-dependent peptidase ImmA (M78 family)
MATNYLREAEDKAKVARRGFTSVLPVPLEQIARREGIKIELTPLDDDLSGMSFIKNNVAVIVLNLNHHPNRRRFTLAHEIGHHLLHMPYLTDNVHVDKIVLNRDLVSSQAVDPKEMEANAFAAELLMPEAELLRYHGVDLNNDDFLYALAKKLKVSVTALTYRLIKLGMVPPNYSAAGT